MQKPTEISKGNANVKDFGEVNHILENIDWDFSLRTPAHGKLRPFDCRKHHWFPATFIPEIPFTMIEVLTHPKASVYDPFSGIGTTYFQALSLNRRPLATEICEVAVQFMKSLLILFDPMLELESLKDTLMKIAKEFEPHKHYTERIRHDRSIKILMDRLQPWYHERTFNQLSYLFIEEHYCDNTPAKAAMRILISAILRRACSQDRGWGCIADNMLPKPNQIIYKDVISLFKKDLKYLISRLQEHLGNIKEGYDQLYSEVAKNETIFHTDVRNNEHVSSDSVDLIVTSPSYPNMTDYVKSQRLSYYWLGIPISSANNDLISEIGARRKRQSKDALKKYLEDMQICIKILSSKVREGGFVCFVMPLFGRNDLKRKRIIHKVMSELERLFVKEKEFERIIPAVRRAHNIKWATLEREKIFVFRK